MVFVSLAGLKQRPEKCALTLYIKSKKSRAVLQSSKLVCGAVCGKRERFGRVLADTSFQALK